MNVDNASIVLIGGIAKQCLTVVIAGLCIFFGFRLFYLTTEKSSSFEASLPWGKVRLADAAPGVFFTLFGCIVLLTVTLAPASYKETKPVPSPLSGPAGAPQQAANTVEARAGMAGVAAEFDWATCARSANYALNDMKSRSGVLAKSRSPTEYRERMQGGLQQTLALCVDKALGPGTFKRYALYEELSSIGGQANANRTDMEAHQRVEELLGS